VLFTFRKLLNPSPKLIFGEIAATLLNLLTQMQVYAGPNIVKPNNFIVVSPSRGVLFEDLFL
jgi:hypothetical protein